jgi:hypothetical protein
MKVPKELMALFVEMKGAAKPQQEKKRPKTGFLGSKSKAYEEAEEALEQEEERNK